MGLRVEGVCVTRNPLVLESKNPNQKPNRITVDTAVLLLPVSEDE